MWLNLLECGYKNPADIASRDPLRSLAAWCDAWCHLQESGIDDDVLVMQDDEGDVMDEDAVVIPGVHRFGVSPSTCHAC